MAWDGRVYQRLEPGASAMAIDPARRAHSRDQLPVEVEDVRVIQGALWFQVPVSWPSICGGEDPIILARCWMRAFDAEGAPRSLVLLLQLLTPNSVNGRDWAGCAARPYTLLTSCVPMVTSERPFHETECRV